MLSSFIISVAYKQKYSAVTLLKTNHISRIIFFIGKKKFQRQKGCTVRLGYNEYAWHEEKELAIGVKVIHTKRAVSYKSIPRYSPIGGSPVQLNDSKQDANCVTVKKALQDASDERTGAVLFAQR